jgi:hypothetical protein
MRRSLLVAAVGAAAALAIVAGPHHPPESVNTIHDPRAAPLSLRSLPLPPAAVPDDTALTGEVLAPDGVPCPGAIVALVWLSDDDVDTHADGELASDFDDPLDTAPDVDVARTDERGRFRIPVERTGRARLTATHGPTAAAVSPPILVGGAGAPRPAPTTLRFDGTLAASRVEARVHEPEGGAVVDALVLALVGGEGLVFAARTDRSGAAALALPGRAAAVYARADGYASAGRKVIASPAGAVEIDLVLVPGATLSGRVIVAASGHPAPRARVRVDAGDRRGRRGFTRAGADGRFRLTVAAGPIVARARIDHLVGESRAITLARGENADVTIAVAPGGRLTGLVRDEDGRPIGGARVVADGAETTSHADGEFVLDGIERRLALFGRQRVDAQASHPDFCSAKASVELDDNGQARVEIALDRCASVHGIVLDVDGRPAAGALVLYDGIRATTTDAAGRFRIGRLKRAQPNDRDADEPVEHVLEATKDDASGTLRTARVDGELAIRLERAAVVCGTVRDPEGRPIAHADVTVDGSFWIRSDRAGAFCVGPLDEGVYAIAADDGEAKQIHVRRGERTSAVALVGSARRADIRGVVESADGPVWGASVSGCGTSATTAADGSFTLTAPRDALCEVVVAAPGFVDDGFELSAGDTAARITLVRRPRILGDVVDERGRPVPRFGLLVHASDVHHDVADPGGAFDISVAQPGTYLLFVRDDEGRTGAARIDTEGGATHHVRIVLPGWCKASNLPRRTTTFAKVDA